VSSFTRSGARQGCISVETNSSNSSTFSGSDLRGRAGSERRDRRGAGQPSREGMNSSMIRCAIFRSVAMIASPSPRRPDDFRLLQVEINRPAAVAAPFRISNRSRIVSTEAREPRIARSFPDHEA
jgi:hypothetical protein